MNERGFTVLEVLLAAALLGVILLGIGAFYVATARVQKDNSAQAFLQRQATIIINEMTEQIGEATASSLAIPCPGKAADSLQLTNSRGTYCFRRDAAGKGFLEDRPDGGGGTWNLLSGAAVTLSTTTGACPAAGGFCPTLLTDNATPPNPLGAIITFRLRFQLPGSSGYQAMTFTTTIAARN